MERCGCGGGANIKTLLKLCPKGRVQGIDYSAVSVEKARKVNARAIAAGRCNVQQASVTELPFEAEQFDVATAFETVYFWPELAQNFREVYRVLKPRRDLFHANSDSSDAIHNKGLPTASKLYVLLGTLTKAVSSVRVIIDISAALNEYFKSCEGCHGKK